MPIIDSYSTDIIEEEDSLPLPPPPAIDFAKDTAANSNVDGEEFSLPLPPPPEYTEVNSHIPSTPTFLEDIKAVNTISSDEAQHHHHNNSARSTTTTIHTTSLGPPSPPSLPLLHLPKTNGTLSKNSPGLCTSTSLSDPQESDVSAETLYPDISTPVPPPPPLMQYAPPVPLADSSRLSLMDAIRRSSSGNLRHVEKKEEKKQMKSFLSVMVCSCLSLFNIWNRCVVPLKHFFKTFK